MRKIIFRGKRFDNNEWLYGDLMHVNEQVMINPVFDEPYQYDGDLDANVDPETVGQYTGLQDKSGKEIYEGDAYHLGDKRILSVVEWHDSGFMGKQVGTYGSREGLQHWRDRIEIIGNIHDNPELLK